MRLRTKFKRGFSLAELVVSILILASLSVILVGVIPSAIFGMKSAENRAQAACMARETMERARARNFDALASTDETPRTSNGTTYHIRLEVENYVGADGSWNESMVKDLRVVVTWRDRAGWQSESDNQTYTARTLLFNN